MWITCDLQREVKEGMLLFETYSIDQWESHFLLDNDIRFEEQAFTGHEINFFGKEPSGYEMKNWGMEKQANLKGL